MKLADITIPNYSRKEEFLNSLSHAIGIGMAIAAMVLGIAYAAIYSDIWGVVCMSIYGGSLVLLYTMSTLYHGFVGTAKKVFRVLDHCSVFLLIAGTYTPYTLIALKGKLGWILFAFVWSCSIIGIILNIIDMKKYAKISMICYLLTGWIIIFSFSPLLQAIGMSGAMLLLAGGIAYTIGAILYGIGHKIPYFHSIWHFCILIGSILQYLSVLLYVIK